MAKRRIRTNANVPAKGRLRDMADQLWNRAIRDDWDNKCAVCSRDVTEAHHLIPRQNELFRYDLENGIALCTQHHKFDADIAPHQNAAGWMEWLWEHQEYRAEWYAANCRSQFTGTKTAIYYCDTIRILAPFVDSEDYDRIVGIKFGRWLEEQAGQ